MIYTQDTLFGELPTDLRTVSNGPEVDLTMATQEAREFIAQELREVSPVDWTDTDLGWSIHLPVAVSVAAEMLAVEEARMRKVPFADPDILSDLTVGRLNQEGPESPLVLDVDGPPYNDIVGFGPELVRAALESAGGIARGLVAERLNGIDVTAPKTTLELDKPDYLAAKYEVVGPEDLFVVGADMSLYKSVLDAATTITDIAAANGVKGMNVRTPGEYRAYARADIAGRAKMADEWRSGIVSHMAEVVAGQFLVVAPILEEPDATTQVIINAALRNETTEAVYLLGQSGAVLPDDERLKHIAHPVNVFGWTIPGLRDRRFGAPELGIKMAEPKHFKIEQV